MSLNSRQIVATRNELAVNLALSGQTVTDIALALNFDSARVQAALDVDATAPQDVWLMRDYLNRAIRETGATPHPFSTLTEQARTAAQRWFPLVDVEAVMSRPTR